MEFKPSEKGQNTDPLYSKYASPEKLPYYADEEIKLQLRKIHDVFDYMIVSTPSRAHGLFRTPILFSSSPEKFSSCSASTHPSQASVLFYHNIAHLVDIGCALFPFIHLILHLPQILPTAGLDNLLEVISYNLCEEAITICTKFASKLVHLTDVSDERVFLYSFQNIVVS